MKYRSLQKILLTYRVSGDYLKNIYQVCSFPLRDHMHKFTVIHILYYILARYSQFINIRYFNKFILIFDQMIFLGTK